MAKKETYTVFRCRKCGHELFVVEENFPDKMENIAGRACPNCGEQDEGLWGLLGRSNKFMGPIKVQWEESEEE